MDMTGLEDDPDFWNVTLDSESPVREELKGKSAFIRRNFGTYNHMLPSDPKKDVPQKVTTETKTIVSMSPISVTEEFLVRPDGRYDCNHPCKDKSKCRHLWCVY